MKAITKTVLEFALEEEMSGHVGYDKHAVQSRKGGDCWNGTRSTLGFPPVALFRWRATKVTPCAASGSTSRPSPVDELYVPTTPTRSARNCLFHGSPRPGSLPAAV